ncbi:MAG: serine/threonine protein kinase [Polyangiaceae bacterium]|nr:serine/threonine protein kinase [Polyangiaceae bacterium]
MASGGMATVHLGRLVGPSGFSRTLAIKRLHSEHAKDPDFVAMFLDEARLAARIQHPNVVQTLDVFAEGNEVFLVMEYVRGVTLAQLLKREMARKGSMPIPVAVALLHDVLQGLQAAHEARDSRGEPLHIVHRDVSPQNIVVGADGRALVLDFGIAKAAGRTQQTREGELKGKLAYMAPEQLEGRAEQRTDVFAASVVLWEALTGRSLFRRDTEVETLMQVLAPTAQAPSTHNPGVDGPLDTVVMKGLAPAAADRHASARAMAAELAHFARATPHEVATWVEELAGDVLAEGAKRVAQVESATSPAPNPLGMSSTDTHTALTGDVGPPPRRSRLLALVGAYLVFVGVGIAVSVAARTATSTVEGAPGPSWQPVRPDVASGAPNTDAGTSPSPSTMTSGTAYVVGSASATAKARPSPSRPRPPPQARPVDLPDHL